MSSYSFVSTLHTQTHCTQVHHSQLTESLSVHKRSQKMWSLKMYIIAIQTEMNIKYNFLKSLQVFPKLMPQPPTILFDFLVDSFAVVLILLPSFSLSRSLFCFFPPFFFSVPSLSSLPHSEPSPPKPNINHKSLLFLLMPFTLVPILKFSRLFIF